MTGILCKTQASLKDCDIPQTIGRVMGQGAGGAEKWMGGSRLGVYLWAHSPQECPWLVGDGDILLLPFSVLCTKNCKMSNIMPTLSQKDLESITLTRTGFGFSLKAFHALQNKDVSVKLLTTKNATER